MDMYGSRVRRTTVENRSAIAVSGPFDFNDPDIETIAREIASEGEIDLILDFTKVTYLTSPGISCIIKMLKRTQMSGGSLYLYKPAPDMVELLTLANIFKYLKILPSQ